ncbi:uncharacterized protein E5676_scaffold263G00180 [Cucumis melo var. makuwa]|uniref:Uncharacterized protein n=1 Tax=Cucumis melo var. makuwa TaxID=1194695 RepID=A0A5D3CIC4_CUCMM|nr:uncharacterized protein E5676_scaffold263G00180 [Cucumis melo var. makuwa]
MVSKESNIKTLENSLGEIQTKPEVANTKKKLPHQLHKPSIVTMGPPSLSFVQPNGWNLPHASLLLGVWAHVPPSTHLTAQPNLFYASPPVQTSHPSNQPHPHTPFSYKQPPENSNLSGVEVSKPSTHSKPTELPTYSKNPIISLPNLLSNNITNSSAAISARSSTHDSEKNSGELIPVCEHCKKQWHTKDRYRPPTLGTVAQSSMPQSLGLISVDEKNSWISDTGTTDHSTITYEQHSKATFLPESICFPDLISRRTISTT